MSRIHTHIVLFALILLSSMASVRADTEVVANQVNTGQAPVYRLSKSGYIQSIQAKDVAALLTELSSTYRVCQDYRSDLAEDIEDMQIDTGDILISLILPGGLLYYAQKKVRLMDLEEDLVDINEAMVDLETDVARLSTSRQLARIE